jgi:hypothetical protein
MPLMLREAQIVPGRSTPTRNTVDCVWTTGIRRAMYDWSTDQVVDEELVVSADAVDMTRFDAGAVQVLDGHDTYSGVAQSSASPRAARSKAAKGVATLGPEHRPGQGRCRRRHQGRNHPHDELRLRVQRYEVTPAQGPHRRRHTAAVPRRQVDAVRALFRQRARRPERGTRGAEGVQKRSQLSHGVRASSSGPPPNLQRKPP